MTAVTANGPVSAMAGTSSLLTSLTDSTQAFLQPSSALHLEALACVKSLLDPLAANVADTQKARRDENRKKRKRGDIEREEEVLHLRQVYTGGLGVKQVWEQARRVLDAACSEVEREISIQREQLQHDSRQDGIDGEVIEDEEMSEVLDEESDMLEDELADDNSDVDMLEDGIYHDDYDDQEDIEDPKDIEDLEEDEDFATHVDKDNAATYVPDPNGLNDGFFSIDDFNKQTQFLEQQDVRGEDDNPSDEDEIDWDVDPLTMPFHKPKSGQEEIAETQDDNDDEEEEGPTFGNADLNAADSDGDEGISQDENLDLENGMPTISNTNDIRYADFFAPPPKKQSRTKRMRALPKTQPATVPQTQDASELESDMQRAMADVRRDLLESDEELSDTDGSDSDDLRPSNKKNMSTHERQRAAIASEIRRLEAANVAKRDWTLSGEARAADRPLNSLIEEDLEFERTGKPVPVITAEVSEEIEALIKRRILAREFDEVVRRHPDALGGANDTRRGRVEIDDTKPQSGLADIYEQDHLRATDPGYVDKRSASTKRAHEEITRLWKEVSSQLDLLSNLHFKPKRVEAEITTVEDKPTISMEDARPVGVGVNAEESMLAPQEVYRPGRDKGAAAAGGEEGVLVTRKGGASVNKDEMTREEKVRRRRREKERMKKAASSQPSKDLAADGGGASQGAGGRKSKAQDQAELLSDLRKGNVKVVDKKGQLQDIVGKKGKRASRDVAGGRAAGTASAGSFKL
ncbi:U3 snoRNP protein [Knufia peltigerae]|uniref:U3 small nucleolar ribonucleoprotein protein MPP10 n=1 Tax=Knufia peltigerae TaxID=1002370 RepID=A0AA38Y8M2_9EURO|nr:U3 snoRNP protein [Knufia peltigerae]